MRNFKVRTQLVIGFIVMFLFLITMGFVANYHSNKIQNQTEIIYNHPLQVRVAIGRIQTNIMKMRLSTRDLMLAKTQDEQQNAIIQMKQAEAEVTDGFKVLRERFLGEQSLVDSAYVGFINWNTVREENTKLALMGDIETVKISIRNVGKVGIYREKMMVHLNKIEKFAEAKSTQLFNESAKLHDMQNNQLLVFLIFSAFFTVLILIFLLQNIRKPIKELTAVANRFREGDMSARSTQNSANEFGVLAAAFNLMVAQIEENTDITDKTDKLASSMLVEDNAHRFFRELLPVLSEQTNSQMVAVYLLTEDKKRYVHYESVGMDNDAYDQVFSATGLPGEFGSVLLSHKIQRVKNIPIDTRFIFQTVSGNAIPREIITIPIMSGDEVIAIISLASVRKYSVQTNILIDRIFDILSARVEGIFAYRKMRKFAEQLEVQNVELDTQKREMTAQSAELSEQNRELEIQRNQLGEANRLKTNFLSNMSHELRTPLNSVIALSGVLIRRLNQKINPEEYSYIEVIERNGKHLLTLINDILDISRIEAGREEVEISKFNVEEVTAYISSMIEPQAQQKKIKLIQKPTGTNIFITSDVNKFRHILQNLIGNAVKFTEKGKVELEILQKNETIEILVTDTGIGISEKHLEHIFDEFRQADASTSRRYGGTGLGLAIAKKYANLLGGTITVKSKPEKGSTFTLVLPINYSEENRVVEIVESAVEFKPQLSSVAQKLVNKKTILLVDDSEPAIIQINDILEESGYKMLVAHDGSEALSIISTIIPDAMILDLMMPGMDGFEVLETIRNAELTAHIPIVILTAKQITHEELKFLKRNNVYQFIQKGDVNRSELLNCIAGLVHTEPVNNTEIPTSQPKEIKGKPTVLIVEDNIDNMITIKAIIGNKFDIIEAIDGDTGVMLSQKHIPHLILMDIALPGIDGIQAFKIIRQNGKLSHIPVIALTASALTTDREAILAHGFDAYIAKPIDEKELFIAIDRILYGK